MSKARLHSEVDRLIAPRKVWQRMLLHALIDLEVVTAMTCSYGDCHLGAGFDPGERPSARTLSIDHRKPRCAGGSDRPNNLQIMHYGCNIAKSGKESWQGATGTRRRAALLAVNQERGKRRRQSIAMQARWHNQEYRARQQAAVEAHPWSRNHSCCTNCGTTERPHKAFGLCYLCYFYSRQGRS